jgi:antitoxin CcdA
VISGPFAAIPLSSAGRPPQRCALAHSQSVGAPSQDQWCPGGDFEYRERVLRILDAHGLPRYNAHMKRTSGLRRSARTLAKRATNVSIRSDLLDAAREAGLNLSATLERALAEELATVRRARWREENREAIAAYNDYVDKHGTFSDGVRSF